MLGSERETDKLFDEASNVVARAGLVVVDGPDGVAVSLTPEAAAPTSDRLFDAAAMPAGQRRTGAAGRKQRSRAADLRGADRS